MADPPADKKNLQSSQGPQIPPIPNDMNGVFAFLAALHREFYGGGNGLAARLQALEIRVGEVATAATAAGTAAANAQTTADAAATDAAAALTAAAGAAEQANTAEAKAVAADAKAAAAETKAGAAETKAGAAETKAGAAETKAGAAETKAGAAETKAETAGQSADAATAAVAEVKVEVGAATVGVQQLREAFGDNLAVVPPPQAKLAPFLTVPLRDVTFDPIAEKAIAAVLAARKVDAEKLAKDIVAVGVATAIGKVSERLGRARITEARRHILAVAYPDLLSKRLGTPVNVEVAKDPIGLAQSLLDELDVDGSPLDTFVDAVVAASEKSMSLNLQDHERRSLRQRVRASL